MNPRLSLQKMLLESRIKRINFKYCVIPAVKKAVESGSDLFKIYDCSGPYIHILSEDWLELRESAEKEIWSDSITIQFGSAPLPIRPIVPHKTRLKILSEKQACLVISQSVSGDVVALIYPPRSDLLASGKECYVFERWSEPTNVTEKKILDLLKFTLEINTYTQALVYPNKRGIKLAIKLQVKDEVLSNGGSRTWVWIMYIKKLIIGVARIYGFGAPNK